MKLSIITINYNNCEGLQRTIESVIEQSYNDFEWILVDGGSSDGSRELIEKYKDHFSWWCSDPDRGIYHAMNKGISRAHGEYLNFLNSGDTYCDGETLAGVFAEEREGDILYGDALLSDGQIWRVPKKVYLSYLHEKSISHQSAFIRREIFEGNMYDESYRIVSDWKNWIIWLLQGKTFTYLPMAVSRFDIEGLSNTRTDLRIKECQQVLDEFFPPAVISEFKRLQDYDMKIFYFQELVPIYEHLTHRRLFRRIFRGMNKFLTFLKKIIG